MKCKGLIMLVVLLLLTSLTACDLLGSSTKNPAETTVTVEDTTVPNKETSAPDVEEPKPHEHVWSNWIIVTPAKCEEDGEQERNCSCGEKEIEVLPATGHDTMTMRARAPRCEAEGWDEYEFCKKCSYSTRVTIPALGHDEVANEAKAATCTEEGWEAYVSCSRCKYTTKKIIPASGHSVGEWVIDIEPTCIEKGEKHQDCKVCLATVKIEEIAAQGHSGGEWIVDLEATCTEDGSKHQVCSVCEVTIATKSIASSHTESKFVIDVAATIYEEGVQHTYCTVCLEKMQTNVAIPKVVSNGLAYIVNPSNNPSNKTCRIIGVGACTDVEIGIPSTIDGYKVTEIGAMALAENEKITAIVVPNSVVKIGWRAFYESTALSKIIIPESVAEIGTQIFYGCDNLTTVYYNGSYGSSNNPFLVIESIEKVIFGGTKVPSYVLADNSYIKTVVIEDTVTSIGDNAFRYCSGLASITIPNSVTSIGDCAFVHCTGLKSIEIPDSVTSIDDGAFNFCTGLTNIEIPDSVTRLGSAFHHCTGLRTVVIGDGVTTIERETFSYCGSINNVVLGDSVRSINYAAFEKCYIPGIIISSEVNYIHEYAFPWENWKTIIYYQGIMADWEDSFRKVKNVVVYCYSENEPADDGKYWHYVNGVPQMW